MWGRAVDGLEEFAAGINGIGMTADTIEQKIDYTEISCQSCGSNLLVEPQMLTAICPYCASPSIIQRPPSENLPSPEFTIGFVVTQDRAIEAVSFGPQV